MKKTSVVFIVLFALLTGCSGLQNAIDSSNQNQSFIWKVSGGELVDDSYIIGTVPIQDSFFYKYPDRIWSYLDKSDVFISFDNETNSSTESYRKNRFKQFGRHYSILPAKYFQQNARERLKPVITLNESLSLQTINTSADQSPAVDALAVKNDFLTGDLDGLVSKRLQLDLSQNQLQQLQDNNNYQLLEGVIRHMKLQPVFFPVDVAYLSGETGLLSLLRARGYQVTPMQTKYYRRNAQALQEQNRQMGVQQPNTGSNKNAVPNQENYQLYTKPEKEIPLNLPVGMINMSNWGNYSLKDSLLFYQAPGRLKAPSELEEYYEVNNDSLNYSIALQAPFSSFDAALQQLIIRNGGQLTQQRTVQSFGYPAVFAELIYAENQLSKHLLIAHPQHGIIVSVKGKTPQIFSEQANQFIESITPTRIRQTQATQAENPSLSQGNQKTRQTTVAWGVKTIANMQVFLPMQPKTLSGNLPDGTTIEGKIIPRGAIDNNLYLITATPDDPIDTFRLFNEAINKASSEARAVITERSVMPEGKMNYSSYLLRDSVENYYRVHYWFQNGNFYQFIIKGGERSVNNETANRIFNSISFN